MIPLLVRYVSTHLWLVFGYSIPFQMMYQFVRTLIGKEPFVHTVERSIRWFIRYPVRYNCSQFTNNNNRSPYLRFVSRWLLTLSQYLSAFSSVCGTESVMSSHSLTHSQCRCRMMMMKTSSSVSVHLSLSLSLSLSFFLILSSILVAPSSIIHSFIVRSLLHLLLIWKKLNSN